MIKLEAMALQNVFGPKRQSGFLEKKKKKTEHWSTGIDINTIAGKARITFNVKVDMSSFANIQHSPGAYGVDVRQCFSIC